MKLIIRIFIFLFIVGNIGSFFTLGTSLFIFLRYFSTIILLLLLCFNYKYFVFQKGIVTFFIIYLFTFYILPLILIASGIYNLGITNIVINAHYYLATILCCLFIANFYKQNKKYNLFKDLTTVTVLFLIVGIIMFRDVSLNVGMLLNNILQNTRADRSYLGFNNPNQVAITVTLLIVATYLSNIKNIWKYFLYTLSFVVLLNTGSRTPLFSLIITAILMCIFISFNHISNIYVKSIILTFFLGLLTIVTLMIVNYLFTFSTDFFINLDNLTTNRLGRQIYTIDSLARTNNLWFGVGMFNTSFFNAQNQFLGLHPDSYYAYSLVTTGIIGLLFNAILILLLLIKSIKIQNRSLLVVSLICIIYAGFEGTLFFPTSLLTLLLLVTLFFMTNEGRRDNV